MGEWGFTCTCGAPPIRINVDDSSHNDEVQAVKEKLGEHSWVIGESDFNSDGNEHFFAYCSLRCHNDRVTAIWKRNNSDVWWNMHGGEHDGEGPRPKCTCTLEKHPDGRLSERRVDDCPWHTWLDERRGRRNAETRALYEKWKDVPIGTIVRERDNVNKGRGLGRTTGPPNIFEYSFGGHLGAVVPWDQPGIHPRLRDLELYE